MKCFKYTTWEVMVVVGSIIDSFRICWYNYGFIGGLGTDGETNVRGGGGNPTLISGFNAYLRVYWILNTGNTLGEGVRDPTLMMKRLNSRQIQDAIHTGNW